MTSGQSYKASTIVIYDSRVVNYERKLFIRLATEHVYLALESLRQPSMLPRGLGGYHVIESPVPNA